jgi:Zn-dependent protease
MTWNPLVHMGGFSLMAFALIGIAWGAMPVDPSRLRGRHGAALVALAGPAMNIVLAIVSFAGLVLWLWLGGTVGDPLRTNLVHFFRLGVWLNIVLAVFNLLPVLPLDGGRIAASLSPAYDRVRARRERAVGHAGRVHPVLLVRLRLHRADRGDPARGRARDREGAVRLIG